MCNLHRMQTYMRTLDRYRKASLYRARMKHYSHGSSEASTKTTKFVDGKHNALIKKGMKLLQMYRVTVIFSLFCEFIQYLVVICGSLITPLAETTIHHLQP